MSTLGPLARPVLGFAAATDDPADSLLYERAFYAYGLTAEFGVPLSDAIRYGISDGTVVSAFSAGSGYSYSGNNLSDVHGTASLYGATLGGRPGHGPDSIGGVPGMGGSTYGGTAGPYGATLGGRSGHGPNSIGGVPGMGGSTYSGAGAIGAVSGGIAGSLSGRTSSSGSYGATVSGQPGHVPDSVGGVPPIIIDLDGDGVELVSLAHSTAFFDIDKDGFRENMGWAAPTTASSSWT